MKKNWAFFAAIVVSIFSLKLIALNTDIANWGGQGVYNNKDMVRIGKSYSLHLYNGSIQMGDSGLIPSTNNPGVTFETTDGSYYGIKVAFFNGSGASTQNGSVICASTTYSSSVNYEGTMLATLATTTVMGVSDGIVANGAVGEMTISGYALVQTTGAVPVGALLVSTGGTNGSGAAGYAGQATGTVAVGTVIGKALTAGTASGGTVLALITQE
jgi:hypothetical protein